jgi:hypothetical protein
MTILISDRLMILNFAVLKGIKDVPDSRVDLRHSELLSELQRKFMLYWMLKHTSVAAEYLIKIKKMIIDKPDLYNIQLGSWIHENTEEISEHLASQLLRRLDTNQQIGSILDQFVSIGHLNKVGTRALEKGYRTQPYLKDGNPIYRPSKLIYTPKHLGWKVYSGTSFRFCVSSDSPCWMMDPNILVPYNLT